MTAEQPFVRTGDHVTAAPAGNDTLNIYDAASTGATTAMFDTYKVGVTHLNSDGQPTLYGAGYPDHVLDARQHGSRSSTSAASPSSIRSRTSG